MALSLDQPTNGAATTTPPRPARGPVLLENRYQIHPDQPLPDLDSPSAKAYAVEDRSDTGREVFALVCNPALPPRALLMETLRGLSIKGLLPLVEWGPIDWPELGQRCMCVIYERPLGGRVTDTYWAENVRIHEHEIVKKVFEPLLGAVQRLAAREIAHREIRPNNLFYMDHDRQTIVLGDCVTVPPGFDQPVVFEVIERGMASLAGRGEGTVAEDIYALGVTLVFLSLGSNPIAHLGEDDLVRAKVEHGAYATICGRERVPVSLIEPLRGMLSDEPSERWGLEELDQWMAGKRLTPLQRKAAPKTDKPFEFMGHEFVTARTLARALTQAVTEAATVIKEGSVEQWLRRGLNDSRTADAVAESVQVAKAHESDSLGSNDYLVAKIAICLDRLGPIRYKDFAVMPDGFGPAMATELLRQGNVQVPAEVLLRELHMVWITAQNGTRPAAPGLKRTLETMRAYVTRTDIGYGVERALYELNPGLPCQSPLVAGKYVQDLEQLLSNLDEASKHVDSKTKPVDRHVAAFIAARCDQDLEAYLAALGDNEPRISSVGMLSLIAFLQWRLDTGPLLGLTSWVGGQLGPAITSYHSRSTRRQIEREIPRLIRQGNLPELYDFIDNREKRQADLDGFTVARNQHAVMQAEIEKVESSDSAQLESAERIGQQTAAVASIVMTLIVVCLVILMENF